MLLHQELAALFELVVQHLLFLLMVLHNMLLKILKMLQFEIFSIEYYVCEVLVEITRIGVDSTIDFFQCRQMQMTEYHIVDTIGDFFASEFFIFQLEMKISLLRV